MKSIRYVALVIVFLFVTVIPVSAQIDDLYVMALEYYNENCLEKDIKKEKALLCYLFEKTEDLDNRVVVLENQTPSSVKQIYIYDDDGNELGIYMGDSMFFYEPLERMVRPSYNGLQVYAWLYFAEHDCSDTAIHVSGVDIWALESNSIWGGKNFITNEELYYKINLDNYFVVDDEWKSESYMSQGGGGEIFCVDEPTTFYSTNPHSGLPHYFYRMEIIPPELLPEYIVHPAFPLRYKAK